MVFLSEGIILFPQGILFLPSGIVIFPLGIILFPTGIYLFPTEIIIFPVEILIMAHSEINSEQEICFVDKYFFHPVKEIIDLHGNIYFPKAFIYRDSGIFQKTVKEYGRLNASIRKQLN